MNNLQAVKKFDRIILGIDPGTVVMGYGIIGIINKKATVISMGVVKMDTADEHSIRLKRIFERTLNLIEQFVPDELSIEAPFFGKNVQSMLKLGRAQGVAIAAAMSREMPVHEYSPRKIKQSITGNGNSSKEQVAAMLQRLLVFEELPKFLDATDGLAVAYCHYLQNIPSGGADKKFGSWKSYVSANKEKVKK